MFKSRVASPAQCRAARAMLGWTQKALADNAHVARRTLSAFEANRRPVHLRTRRDITAALEAAGIVFVTNNGGEGIVGGLRMPPVAAQSGEDPSTWTTASYSASPSS